MNRSVISGHRFAVFMNHWRTKEPLTGNRCDHPELSKILLKLFFIKEANSSVGLIRKNYPRVPGLFSQVCSTNRMCHDVTATSLRVVQRNLFQFYWVFKKKIIL